MMTFAFNTQGECMYCVNKPVSREQLSDAAFVVEMPDGTDVNLVRYDVANGMVVLKRNIQPSVSANTISGLPMGTTAICNGESVEVSDGAVEFEVSYPQTLRVTLMHPHYLITEVEVLCEVQG